MKIAVFVSGGGTNLQNIIDAVEDGTLPNVEISMVMADRDCYAIERSLDKDIRTYVLDRKTFSEDAIVCMQVKITTVFIKPFLCFFDSLFEFCNF